MHQIICMKVKTYPLKLLQLLNIKNDKVLSQRGNMSHPVPSACYSKLREASSLVNSQPNASSISHSLITPLSICRHRGHFWQPPSTILTFPHHKGTVILFGGFSHPTTHCIFPVFKEVRSSFPSSKTMPCPSTVMGSETGTFTNDCMPHRVVWQQRSLLNILQPGGQVHVSGVSHIGSL